VSCRLARGVLSFSNVVVASNCSVEVVVGDVGGAGGAGALDVVADKTV
jgi:hypothetical protein